MKKISRIEQTNERTGITAKKICLCAKDHENMLRIAQEIPEKIIFLKFWDVPAISKEFQPVKHIY